MSEQIGETGKKLARGVQSGGSVLDSTGIPGLDEAVARERLAQEGPNELPAQNGAKRAWRVPRRLLARAHQPFRQRRPGPWVVLGACAFLVLVRLVPIVQRRFHFAPPHPTDVVFSLSAGVACILWFELVKLVKGRLAWGGGW